MGIRPRVLGAAALFAVVGGGIMAEDRRRRMIDYFEHQQRGRRLRAFSSPPPSSPSPSSPALNVVVIGGGIAGLSVAYYLKLLKPSTNVLVVEAESLAGLASSHNAGTVGLVQEFDLADARRFKPEWHDVLELLSVQAYRGLEDCELVESGALLVAETAREVDYLVAKHQHLANKGFTQAQLLSTPRQVREVEPALSAQVLAAVHYPGSVHVDPRKASLGMAQAAGKLGVEFLEGDGAVGLVEGRDWTVMLSSGKALVCDVVVVANGLGCNKLLSETLVAPVKGQIGYYDNGDASVRLNKILFSASMHVALADRLVESTPPHCTLDTSIRHLYGRQTATGELVLGGSRIPATKLDYRPDVGVARSIASHAQQLLPGLPPLPSTTWACYMPFSVDGKPFVGRSEYSPRLYLSVGFGPEGMTHAPGAGLVLAQQIYGLSLASSAEPNDADSAALLVLRELDPNRKRRKIRPHRQ